MLRLVRCVDGCVDVVEGVCVSAVLYDAECGVHVGGCDVGDSVCGVGAGCGAECVVGDAADVGLMCPCMW